MKLTPVDEYISFRIFTPSGVILPIKAQDMPLGCQTWDTDNVENMARRASERLGLRVTAEVLRICTADPKMKEVN